MHFAIGARTAAGSVSVLSQLFAAEARASQPSLVNSASVLPHSAANRAAMKQPSATSRAPPIGARPASAARWRKGNDGVARA